MTIPRSVGIAVFALSSACTFDSTGPSGTRKDDTTKLPAQGGTTTLPSPAPSAPAAVSPPPAAPLLFETTFNCPEWNQAMGVSEAAVCGSGDGIAGWGGWTTSAGSVDQITALANNPAGKGGRGYRHWRGDGQNNNGGGLAIALPKAVREMWVRFYMRYQAGFQWANGEPHYTKEMLWELAPNPGGAGQFVFGFNGGGVGFHPYSSVPNYPSSATWSAVNGGALGDGKFHSYEFHMRADTPGSNNGLLEVWVDGVKKMSINDADLSNGSTEASWSWFIWGDNSNNPANGGDRHVDYDDLAISTAGYVGPL